MVWVNRVGRHCSWHFGRKLYLCAELVLTSTVLVLLSSRYSCIKASLLARTLAGLCTREGGGGLILMSTAGLHHSSCFLDPDLLGTSCPEDVAVLPYSEDLCVHLHVLISSWAFSADRMESSRPRGKPQGARTVPHSQAEHRLSKPCPEPRAPRAEARQGVGYHWETRGQEGCLQSATTGG